ncbi:hypothetical protein DNH61_09950 [Paenibacillus sambharensis]|uniref:Tyrosine specific protein phosphatases domain-containing protein n=1 Tax=Paenibacillus sambharensis TaxID=1803190 RepID=A0A2W1LVG7_9BACL|nr:dual specificity protein phosphatase family protein [Paenibacillus sambharensis]PZD95771.1 hypothetical protein DNH61_09950 [Paenibacillus sambharensis]
MAATEMIHNILYASGSLRGKDWEFVSSQVTVVVNLSLRPDLPPDWLKGTLLLWEPLPMWQMPKLPWLINLVYKINRMLDKGETVLVHCTNGKHRAGLVLTALYMVRYRLGRERALQEVRKRKPDLSPPLPYLRLLDRLEEQLSVKPDSKG